MIRIAPIAVICLFSGWAAAEFTLKDPALDVEEAFKTPATEAAVAYTVEGAGGKSCSNYLADRKDNGTSHYIDLNWARGFISGINYIHTQTPGNSQLGTYLDLDALTLWIDKYCISNPRDTLADASTSLANELMN